MQEYIVYRHITPDGKSYIGATGVSLNQRFQNGRGYKNCTRFNKAIKKFGWQHIQHEILFKTSSKEEAYKKEILFIDKLKTTNKKYGYNIELGGSKKGLKGKYNSFYGKTHSDDQKQKWSKERKGKKPWNKNKFGAINKTTKKVECLETGIVYEGVRDVERKLNILHSSISRCCLKKYKNKTAGGYHWQFV